MFSRVLALFCPKPALRAVFFHQNYKGSFQKVKKYFYTKKIQLFERWF
jgi:hypothetical protein